MLKFLIAALLALPAVAYAQAIPETPAPVGSFTGEMVYLDDTSQIFPLHVAIPPGGLVPHDRSLFGWSAVPEINVFKRVGLQGDIGSLYMRSVYPGQTQFTMAAGPKITFVPHSPFTPFVYAEGGEMRYSVQYHSDKTWMPVAKGGIGFDYRITPGFGVTLVPAEYMATYQDTRTWNNSFEARFGITFNLLARKSYLW
jgi:hypothetical protein